MPIGCGCSTFWYLKQQSDNTTPPRAVFTTKASRIGRARRPRTHECRNNLVLVAQELDRIGNAALKPIECPIGNCERLGIGKRIAPGEISLGPAVLRQTDRRAREEREISERVGLEWGDEHVVHRRRGDAEPLEDRLGSSSSVRRTRQRSPAMAVHTLLISLRSSGRPGLSTIVFPCPSITPHVEVQNMPGIRRTDAEHGRARQFALPDFEQANAVGRLRSRNSVRLARAP